MNPEQPIKVECAICGVACLPQFLSGDNYWICGDCYEEECMRCGPIEDNDDD